MKTKTDIMDLIRFICDFYNSYRECLNLTHEEARHKTELTYDDLHEWLYGEDKTCETKTCETCVYFNAIKRARGFCIFDNVYVYSCDKACDNYD